MRVSWLACLLLASVQPAAGQGAPELDKRLTVFTLANGLRFVVWERHEAPVVAFHTYVGGGAVDDPAGQTGLAQLLGRMAFKGTESIGTRNWVEEKKALDALDEAHERMEAERNKGPLMNQEQFENLRTQWRLAVDAALRYSDAAEYSKILFENGASGARTSANFTSLQAGYTLPSNRIELWFAMESQRLLHPVLREFDRERAAVIEAQNKLQTNPQARMSEALLAAAFSAHPYRNPAAGWLSDLPQLKRSEGRAYLEEHFVPGNIVAALSGDVDPVEAKRLAERYFGPIPSRPMPARPHTTEPAQLGPRTVELDLAAPPLAAVGYKRPSYFDKDDAALDVLEAILGSGASKNGMAWRELVDDKKLAAGVQITATYPDGYYPSLFVFFYAPAPGRTIEDVQKALDEMLFRLRSQKLPEDVVEAARARAQASAYQKLAANAAMAEMLATYAGTTGDARKLFRSIEDFGKVSVDDVLRAAQRYLVPANRTTVYIALPAAARPVRSGGAR